MNPYITYSEYKEMGGNTLPENDEKYFKKASRMIDSLSFNIINKYWMTTYSKNETYLEAKENKQNRSVIIITSNQ